MSAEVDNIDCRIGEFDNELLFNFNGINKPKLTQIKFEITNFRNPWSGITIESIRVNSYESADCSGNIVSSKAVGSQTFYAKTTPEKNFKLTSSTNVLGNSSADNEITFAWTPLFSTSLDGRG